MQWRICHNDAGGDGGQRGEETRRDYPPAGEESIDEEDLEARRGARKVEAGDGGKWNEMGKALFSFEFSCGCGGDFICK